MTFKSFRRVPEAGVECLARRDRLTLMTRPSAELASAVAALEIACARRRVGALDRATNADLPLDLSPPKQQRGLPGRIQLLRLRAFVVGVKHEAVGSVLMRLGQDELDEADEEVKDFLGDKDRFMNSCQNHHDSHVNTIDTAEETMSKEEKRRHEAEVEELREWQATRNRGRVAEMLAMRKRYRGEIEEYLEGE